MRYKEIAQEELDKIIELHRMWLGNIDGGVRADLRDVDLRGMDLSGANLSGAALNNACLHNANLNNAVLRYTDLKYSLLSNANLSNADLRGVDLSEACLSFANLKCADLTESSLMKTFLVNADLSGANLRGADLRGADLSHTILTHVNVDEYTSGFLSVCPTEGSFIGWKKCKNDRIVKLLIPEHAKRSSATTRKCRCDKAKVLSIMSIDKMETYDTAVSVEDSDFIYTVGEIVSVDDFNDNRWVECSTGIHFFITREEAVMY